MDERFAMSDAMNLLKTRLRLDNGQDWPAWVVGRCLVFRVPEEKADEGRVWFVFDSHGPWLAETAQRADAMRMARERTESRPV